MRVILYNQYFLRRRFVRKAIHYPYMPEGRQILYVSEDNLYMRTARQFAKSNSQDKVLPGAAVIVNKDGYIIGAGANGSDYHKTHPCRRVMLGCKTGEGYELCEGCHPKNHSEPKAIAAARSNGHDTRGADLYLWGHWWCCKPCWDSMIEAGINNAFLLEGSETLFNKENPDNIVGRQFELSWHVSGK